jgi:hypothetical protein
MSAVPYEVKFGQIGRTLIYTDEGGELTFGFEPSLSRGPDGKYTICLEEPSARPKNDPAVKERIRVAAVRVRNYLVSCGYNVAP